MKNKLLSLIFFILVFSINAKGQYKIYKHRNIGLGIIYFNYNGYQIYENYPAGLIKKPVQGYIAPLTAYFDWNYPIINIKNNSSIGIDPGITLSANPFTLGFSVPVFLNYKFGTDAQTRKKGSNLGFSSGIGYAVGGYANDDFELLFNKPMFMLEMSFQTGYLLNKIRFQGTFGGISFSKAPVSGEMGGSYQLNNYMGFIYSFIIK